MDIDHLYLYPYLFATQSNNLSTNQSDSYTKFVNSCTWCYLFGSLTSPSGPVYCMTDAFTMIFPSVTPSIDNNYVTDYLAHPHIHINLFFNKNLSGLDVSQ